MIAAVATAAEPALMKARLLMHLELPVFDEACFMLPPCDEWKRIACSRFYNSQIIAYTAIGD